MDLVSIVLPCYNPTPYLLEALASAKAQSHPRIEIIVVNDGSRAPESVALLDSISGQVDRYISQPNKGLPAARNAGFSAAAGDYVVPLDCDDVLDRAFVSSCLDGMQKKQQPGFIYSDYRVFGRTKHIERLPEYNLYRLLNENTLIYAALIRKSDWAMAGGYNEAMRLGYEDWDFWLRMAEHRRFGYHLRRVLFGYRKHGHSLLDTAREHHEELLAQIRSNHPGLYDDEAPARIKAAWAPAVAVVGAGTIPEQTVRDCQKVSPGSAEELLSRSSAPAYLLSSGDRTDSHSAELAAWAIWGGASRLTLPDGSTALSRAALQRKQPNETSAGRNLIGDRNALPFFARNPLEKLQRHMANAGLLSLASWFKYPLRSTLRLVPLAVKERVNRLLGRSFFDLTFYLKFQPKALIGLTSLAQPLEYLPPRASTRRRVAFVTPHLGAGGAEQVLLEIAGALDRSRYEVFVAATHRENSRWLSRWQAVADHVYDFSTLIPDDRMMAGIYSLALNWHFDVLVIQNTLFAYSALPALKKALPRLRVIDLIHATGDGAWDLAAATLDVAPQIDVRVVISKAARDHLRRLGIEDGKISLIPNGVDLLRFRDRAVASHSGCAQILFAARLDPVKRPLFLVDIALALKRRRGTADFLFVVAGDGPEEPALRRRLQDAGVFDRFIFKGHVADIAPLLVETDILLISSRTEGIPLILLEALASGLPVVAADVGAISEALDPACGFLIETGLGEAERFAEAIHTLLEDQELRRAMGREGRRKAEAEFSGENSRRMYRELFV